MKTCVKCGSDNVDYVTTIDYKTRRKCVVNGIVFMCVGLVIWPLLAVTLYYAVKLMKKTKTSFVCRDCGETRYK